ncbi:SDR family NAD(P)-dependent oxidoreductase [Pantoea phytobeneficialis]|uniref:2-deoxy-D-gluconate 3-dehydrogenase n=1 Tax=Pantoea phytobeneficialis TaxID=2052056 RepID=A0AAP9KS39_9GAMM|nr:SDR family oxidoreductase [Pantoea phytobeneficialis]MDO6407505.1 SDR family oxidoreductase [Pantoea phytobeneficialis]QGR09447.1 2-deoxy-D-gluconate 3-dehydrogenase [Pantoea phytobeneficialis]
MKGLEQFSLQGKRALVTGSSRGIGFALASGLAQAGAQVTLCGRDAATLDNALIALRQIDPQAEAWPLDVSQPQAIRDFFARLPPFDVVINNAGTEQLCPSLDVDEALWQRIVDTNLKGAFFVAQAAARGMVGRGGAILNLCSLTSEVGVPGAAAYGASKSGLAGLTRTLATEWAGQGIRVNGLGPGYFSTDLTAEFYEDSVWCAAMLQKIPLGRFGELDDLVGTAIFLCSDASKYLTGQVIYVDGGYLAAI